MKVLAVYGHSVSNIKHRFAKEIAKRLEKVQFRSSQKFSHGQNESLVVLGDCRGHYELL